MLSRTQSFLASIKKRAYYSGMATETEERMTWLERELAYIKLQREAERLAAQEIDRERNPELWRSEVPAIWHRGDLAEGDAARDWGKK
jgi:hypothetical protein